MNRLTALIALLLPLAAPALAEGLATPGADLRAPSPFLYAKSGEKAQHRAEVEADTTAGAKVIGGEMAAEGAWPWQVGLMFAGAPVGPDSHFCGGSMLLDTWVLTAAHCIHYQDEAGNWRDNAASDIAVLVGTNTLAPGQGDLIPVQAIFRNPGYVGTAFDNDIALLKLARPPQARYATITVPDAEFGDMLDQQGVTTLVTGWGLTETGEHPEAMRQIQIQMMDRDLCNAALMQSRAEEAVKGFEMAAFTMGLDLDNAQAVWDDLIARAPEPMTRNMLCSGTFEGGKTACSGDSGGPLVVPLEDGTFVQAGIVAWGLSGAGGMGCAQTAHFSAYTRISNYLPWLEQTISANP